MSTVILKRLHMLLVTLFTSLGIYAQVSYHNFNTNSGLPSNEVYCAFQDKDGYMWFGTDHGIAKYNGYEFKVYTTTDGLTDNTVFLIQQDKAGLLWFLTLNGGICFYDGSKFQPHPMNDSITPIFRKRLPTAWQMLDNKTMWLGMIQQGFVRIDSSKVVTFAPTPAYLGPEGTCVEIAVVDLGNGKTVHSMFSNAKMGNITGYEVKGKESYLYDCWYNKEVTLNFNMVQLPNRNILTGIMDMLTVMTPKGRAGQIRWERDKNIANLKQLSNGEIWLTNSNSPSYQVKVRNDQLYLVDSLSFNYFISDIYAAKGGSYWVTTVDKGIYLIQNRDVKKYGGDFIADNQKILHLTKHNQDFYVSLPGNSLLKMNDSIKELLHFAKKDPVPPLSLAFMSSGRVVTNLDSMLHINSLDQWVLPDFYYLKLLDLGKDEFLAGGGGGLAIWSNYNIIYNSQDVGFNKRVSDLCRISANKILVGTNYGLHYFNIHKDRYSITDDTLLPSERIMACHVYSDKLYAIATRGKGVLLYNNSKPYFLNESNGLVSNLAEEVFFENDSTLWIGTYQGLAKAKFKFTDGSIQLKYKCYTTDDGLSSNQINVIEKYNGELWVGTNEGLCHFNPTALSEETYHAPLYFTDFSINGKSHNGNYTFSSDQNNILIEFNALYYKAINGIRYKIRLNSSEQWTYTTQNFIQYYDLPAGDYVFQVAAEDKYGRYESDIKQMQFTIKPHFTDTLQFKAIIGLIVFSILALIIYLLFAYQRFKAQNVIKLLQSEFKALNYQINPHFIFNVLNSIQYYILRKDSDKAVNFLSSFSTLIRRIVSNSRQQYISVIEEVECLKDYLDLEKLRLEDKFDYELNIDSNVDIEQKIMLPMIIQPLVENSIWHGIVPLEERGKIKVDFKRDSDGALICTVEDNGVGINSSKLITKKEQNNLSLAMSNVKERLKIIGELNGSEWFINFRDKSEMGNKERGTIVTIRFPIARKE